MPEGDLLFPVFSLIKYMVGIEFEFEIKVFLKKNDIPVSILGGTGPDSPKLGFSTWIAAPGYQYEQDKYITFQEQYLAHIKTSLQKENIK